MRILKAILLSSISIPVLVFIVFLGAGLVFLSTVLIGSGKYDSGWLGIIYAGSVYAYFASLLSTIPTIVLGLPMSLVAEKYGFLNRKVVLAGSAISGGLFLGITATIFFDAADVQLLLWTLLIGSVGGLLNGYVFLKNMKPNKSPQPTAYGGD